MSGDDQVNATTLLQGSRFLFLTQDNNQSVGLNSYVDVPTNAVMGLVIFDELNDPPNQTRISINNDGITKTFNNGDPTLNVSWSNFYLLKEATQALRLPITANILVANDTIEANDNNLAKTRIASMSALPSVNTQLTLKADTGGAVWEEADLTQNGLTYIDNTGISTSATWTSILAGATPTLTQVLSAGNDATGASIINVNDIQLSTINGSAYPPPTAGFDIVLLNGNNAGASNMDMNNNNITSVNNINVNTINNLTPTTIGLTWGDFTGSNAFTNLPNQEYSVDNGTGLQTDQKCDYFRASSTALNGYNELTATGMEIVDLNSTTSTLYQSNNLTIQNGTAYTITQTSGQNVNINCGQLVINGQVYKPLITYETHSNSNFGISSGTFFAIGSPITWSGLTPSQSYTASIQFSMSCDTYESSSSIYLDYSNSSGSWSSNTYSSSSYPCPQTGSNTTFSGASGYSCFTIIDSIYFQADSFGQLNIQLNGGHNGGTWNTNYRWTFIGTILQP